LGMIPRPRLAYHAGSGVGHVTLLQGPIGFGKSTLLEQWHHAAHTRHEQVALLSLTESDRTMAGLATHLAAVSRAFRERIEQVLTSERTIGVTLFFDEWDAILGSESEQEIGEIIRSGKLRANLCIAGRRACRLPLDNLLTRRGLRLIGQTALKLSEAEQRRLLGPALWNATPAELIQACDGWPLALLLLKCVERGEAPDYQTPSVFARRSGFEAIIGRHLRKVCTPRENELLDFLGLCADIDVSLLNEIRDASDSDELLTGIASLLPFDLHGDGTDLRYRSSGLTRAILQRRFDAVGSARQKAIACRAFQKAMGQGRTLDAINFALLSGEAERGVELLETIGPMRLMMMYGVEPIQHTLSRVPLPLLERSPRLKLAIPVTLAKRGQVAEACDMVNAAVAEIESSSIGTAPKLLALRDSVFVKMQVSVSTNPEWAGDYEREAAAELRKEPAFAAWSTVVAGIVSHQNGCLDEAAALFDQAEVACEQIRARYQLVHLHVHQAHIDLARGRFRSASRRLREVKRNVTVAYPSDEGLLAVAELGLIEAGLALNPASVQLAAIDAALGHLKHSDSWYEPIASALISLSSCLWRDRGLEGVLRGLDDAEADLRRRGITVVRGLAEVLRAYYMALAGETATAQSALEHQAREERQSDDSRLFWRERHYKALAASMVAGARTDLPRALVIADRMIEECRRDGRKVALLGAYLNRANIVLPVIGMRAEGLTFLAYALELAGELGANGCLYEWHDAINDHAVELQEQQLQPRTREMLEQVRIEWQGSAYADLSGREIAVLKRAANGLTNKQISRELNVSSDTIKFHLKHCFRKLRAVSRTDAVQKAREAQLI
jgi:LuxR family transcriptional regulator, maltose regulon positive regulatory protein